MNTLRVEKPWVRESAERARDAERARGTQDAEHARDVERPRVEIRQAMILLASAIAVFALFFVVGRATDAGGGSGVEELPVSSASAPIPASLSTAPPLAYASVEGGGESGQEGHAAAATTSPSSKQGLSS